MFRVEEINSIDQLAGLRLNWQWLLGQTRGATFFQSLDWLEVYWKHFGKGQRLRALSCLVAIGLGRKKIVDVAVEMSIFGTKWVLVGKNGEE